MAVKTATATTSTANTNLDGTSGTYATLINNAGGAELEVDSIYFKATADTADGLINIFFYDGTTWVLLHSVEVEAKTGTGTTSSAWGRRVDLPGFRMEDGDHIKYSTTIAQRIDATVNYHTL